MAKKLTEREFNTIKSLVKREKRVKRIMKLTGRSSFTIWAIRKCAGEWEDYKAFLQEYYLSNQKVVTVPAKQSWFSRLFAR